MTACRNASRQRGLSFFGLLLLLVVLAASGVVLAQLVPTVLEYRAVQRAADRAKAGGSPAEVRQIFDRSAQVDNITAISGRDIQIVRSPDGSSNRVRFAYEREIHLVGPAYLLMKYSGESR